MTTERTHLSIGEVLSLLQPEFPDITISKIRFLESQGLLDPERTPSGYRKFHDDDIEQLRWILTQQRDHFLPLKVIKDRLAAGDLGSGTPEGVLPLASESSNGSDDPSTSTPAASTATSEGDTSEPSATAPDGAAPPTRPEPGDGGDAEADQVGAEASVVDTADEAEASGAATSATDAEAEHAGRSDTDPEAADEDHERARSVGELVEAPEDGADAAEETAEEPVAGTGRKGRHPTGHLPGAPTPEPVEDTESERATVSLTLDELCEQSGLSPREVGELERYGLIAPEAVGQTSYYDEEALVVARLASGFNRYGIEPRHLRMYKVAAEREAGLFEQLITPLLKQRRASARQQAVEMLEELAELADDLRAAMVRSALREYLGGS